MVWDGQITSMVCITMTELMIATSRGHVLRYRWDGTQNRDYCIDLRRTPFCINQQVSKGKIKHNKFNFIILTNLSSIFIISYKMFQNNFV